METATVKAIHVIDGQVVRAGDPLIDLDATNSAADQSRVEADLLTAQLDAARAQAFLQAVQRGQIGMITPISGADGARITDERSRLDGELAEYHAKLARLEAEISHHQAELQTTRELVEKLMLTAPIAQRRAEDYKNLLEKNFISKHGYLEKEQVRIETEGDLAAQRARLLEIQAALETARRERTAFTAEAVRIRHDQLNEAQIKIRQLTQEQLKADQHMRLMTLTAPVDGTVQQLTIHTIGGVVTPAQALLAVVPHENALEAEVMVENKDIGFVFAGQTVEVKLETFPFTKYGTIPGKVDFVSNDAASDEKRGLIYPARVKLARATMQVENKTVNLSPGMAVTVEIKTGSRRVIEYFLSPLLQYKSESLRER
jgi:hemolysin D